MTPQRRTALVSIVAAAALVVLKLGAGLASGSLGLVSEALHSGTDLVAALLTFFAIGVAGRPADAGHQYGHGKAEHLAALAEAAVLALVSIGVACLAVARLLGAVEIDVDPAWWALRGRGRRDRDRRLPHLRLAPHRPRATAARPCARTRCTSPATSSARSRCSPA